LRPGRTRAYARRVRTRETERIHDPERPRPPQPVADDAAPLKELASSVGNRAFANAIARTQGGGIMPGGAVHPAVQSAIDSTRGGGIGLDSRVARRLSPSLGDLSDVRVHTDETSHELNRAVSARAFATGTDVYFAQSEYRPNTTDGDRLIAHELAHVVQQRGAPTSGALTVSNPGDALEREADDVAGRISH
jgi:Domain of unknown function (DUF4157)